MSRVGSPEWIFPESNALLTGADGDSSASSFRGNPIKAICKENLQNPIDARPDKTVPAYVEFHAFSIPAERFPGRDDLANAIKRAAEIASPKGNSREEMYYADAKRYIALDNIPFLRISDSKTTGLLGSDAKKNDIEALRTSNWLHLVRGMGMTTKHNGDGGSHGKGKSAAIANSALNTIFYSTKDIEGKLAFQGVAYLPLFIDQNGTLRDGIGFYGLPDDQFSPIKECISLDPSYSRTEAGTDIYIAGFSHGDKWEEKLLVCVLNEYLLAIYKEILVVRIGETIVDREHLPELMTRYSEICKNLNLDPNDNYASSCWEAITDPELPADIDCLMIEGMAAELQMYIKTGSGPRKTDLIRQIGMRICEYDGKRQFPFPFVGCLYISGIEINQFLAGLEDETHCKWESTRAGKEQKKAERTLTKIKKYVNEKIGRLYKIAKDKKLDAEGMEEYFPIDLDEETSLGEPVESPKNNIASVQIRKYTPAGRTEEYNVIGTDSSPGENPFPVPEPEQKTEPQPEPKPGPKPNPNPEPKPSPNPKPEPAPHIGVQKRPRKILKMKRKNSIGANGSYVLALQGEEDHTAAYIQIVLSGEEANTIPHILLAEDKASGIKIDIQGDLIGPISLSSSVITKINIKTESQTSYSLGVNVYAY